MARLGRVALGRPAAGLHPTVDAMMLLPVQDDAEDPELKEKREVARARHRAWRKVLLDGLDLFSELTQAAANASPGDIELEQDRQVGLSPNSCTCAKSLTCWV